MKSLIKKTLLFIGLLICSIHSIAQDTNIDEPDLLRLNYNVDKFEHLLFLDTYPLRGDFAHLGYSFIFNFHKIIRLTAGLGHGWVFNPNFTGSTGITITTRIGLEVGSKLIRAELGLRPFILHENSPAIGISLGIKSRRFRTFQAGFSWTPIFEYRGYQSGIFNFSAGIGFYINSKKRRTSLGPWQGRRAFKNIKPSIQEMKMRSKKK